MGVCYGTPDFPTPSFTGTLKSSMKLTISSSSSEGCGPSDFYRDGGEVPNILPQPNLTVFTKAELQKATRNFHRKAAVGEGAFGMVYKGLVDERELSSSRKTIIAVKRLQELSMQGLPELLSEVDLLGRINHPNIVKLLGYCLEDREGELMLVYKFIPKGSLDNHLFGRGAIAHPLTWEVRIKIVLGAAKGLAFLHSSEVNIIYRDLKTSNILLDASYTAKLGDFGLARIGPPDGESHVSTRVIGTYGYAAPEYIATGRLYPASDVYSFGVLLLEMMTGSRVMDRNRPTGKHNLVEWSKPYLSSKRRIVTVMDPNLRGKYPIEDLMQMARLTTECLYRDWKKRPSMSEVVRRLEEIAASS